MSSPHAAAPSLQPGSKTLFLIRHAESINNVRPSIPALLCCSHAIDWQRLIVLSQHQSLTLMYSIVTRAQVDKREAARSWPQLFTRPSMEGWSRVGSLHCFSIRLPPQRICSHAFPSQPLTPPLHRPPRHHPYGLRSVAAGRSYGRTTEDCAFTAGLLGSSGCAAYCAFTSASRA